VTTLVYRKLGWRDFTHTAASAARTTGAIVFVIAGAAVFGWLLAFLQVPAAAVSALQSVAHDAATVMLLVLVTLLLLGTFMDLAPMILICTPIFLPVARAYGIDPIHFGVVLILAGGIGLVTPPVGSVLFVGTAIGQISVGQALRTIWPFWLAALFVLGLVAFVPALSLALPMALK
jgi:tripartite ATP-independent transporter DctM subunit